MTKTIGILGGMSPESTVTYYEIIIHEYTRRFGDSSYPQVLIYSVSFQKIMDWLNEGNWEAIGDYLCDLGQKLEGAGADLILIGTNTIHKVYPQVASCVGVPMLHMLDAVSAAVLKDGRKKVGLLGTRFTMEQAFYREPLVAAGLEVIVPDETQRKVIDDVIWKELTFGEIKRESKAAYLEIMDDLAAKGAEGIILGCTEIPLLIHPEDTALPLYDTTRLHALAALEAVLGDG